MSTRWPFTVNKQKSAPFVRGNISKPVFCLILVDFRWICSRALMPFFCLSKHIQFTWRPANAHFISIFQFHMLRQLISILNTLERSLHLDVRLLTCYREQAKVSSVRTREYIHAGIFPYLKRISDRFISTYRYAFSVHQNISNVH